MQLSAEIREMAKAGALLGSIRADRVVVAATHRDRTRVEAFSLEGERLWSVELDPGPAAEPDFTDVDAFLADARAPSGARASAFSDEGLLVVGRGLVEVDGGPPALSDARAPAGAERIRFEYRTPFETCRRLPLALVHLDGEVLATAEAVDDYARRIFRLSDGAELTPAVHARVETPARFLLSTLVRLGPHAFFAGAQSYRAGTSCERFGLLGASGELVRIVDAAARPLRSRFAPHGDGLLVEDGTALVRLDGELNPTAAPPRRGRLLAGTTEGRLLWHSRGSLLLE